MKKVAETVALGGHLFLIFGLWVAVTGREFTLSDEVIHRSRSDGWIEVGMALAMYGIASLFFWLGERRERRS